MGHAHLRVRFYPTQGQWMCVVQRLGADGMPEGEDAVSAVGATKEAARDAAIARSGRTRPPSATCSVRTSRSTEEPSLGACSQGGGTQRLCILPIIPDTQAVLSSSYSATAQEPRGDAAEKMCFILPIRESLQQ